MGNRRRVPEQLLRLILLRISMGHGNATIAREVGVDRKTVRKMRINLQMCGELYPSSPHIIGRPRLLLVAEELVSELIFTGSYRSYCPRFTSTRFKLTLRFSTSAHRLQRCGGLSIGII